MKYHKYPFKKNLYTQNILAKVNKPSYKRLLQMTSYIFTVLHSMDVQ